MKKIIIAIVVILIIASAILVGYPIVKDYIICTKIEEKADEMMVSVKNPSEEVILKYKDTIFKELDNDFLSKCLKNVTSEDFYDVYNPIVKYMEYEIVSVKPDKNAKNTYNLIISVKNIRLNKISEEYKKEGIIKQSASLLLDIVKGADKSETIGKELSNLYDKAYVSNDYDKYVAGTYTIQIVVKDIENIDISTENGFAKMIKNCYGVE